MQYQVINLYLIKFLKYFYKLERHSKIQKSLNKYAASPE